MKVMCIGAHPDDIELGMGGTIVKHVKDGDDVMIVACTLGGVSGNPKERKKEAMRSSKVLRVKNLKILNHPVIKLNKSNNELTGTIQKIIKKEKPARVYTHSPNDFHQVHVGVSNSVVQASKYVNQILFFETISSTTTKFDPKAYVDISKYINIKIKSLASHSSQSKRFYLKSNVIKSLANTRYVWGKVGKNSKGFAEAFEIYKFKF